MSTLHDPSGDLLPALLERTSLLSSYRGVYVSATVTTDARLIETLAGLGAIIEQQRLGSPGLGRRRALEMATETGHPAYLYCDFDRWLHWAGRFPGELLNLPNRIERMRSGPWYVCLGRTRRAFATHPEVQRIAERATNRALSIALGRVLDATAGACWLSPDGAGIIVRHSTETTLGADLEWPGLVWRNSPERISFVRTEGLEFETAEFAGRAITACGGLSNWIEQTYQTPAMWEARLQLAVDSIGALNRALNDPLAGD